METTMPKPVVQIGSRVKYEGLGITIVGELAEFEAEHLTIRVSNGDRWRFNPKDLWDGKITVADNGVWRSLV